MTPTPASELAPGTSDPHASKARYNVVIPPINNLSGDARRFQLSAGCPGLPRMVSDPWSRAQVHTALGTCGLSSRQIEELFRGNRMAFGGRNTSYLFFSESQLLNIGFTFAPDREANRPPAGDPSGADRI